MPDAPTIDDDFISKTLTAKNPTAPTPPTMLDKYQAKQEDIQKQSESEFAKYGEASRAGQERIGGMIDREVRLAGQTIAPPKPPQYQPIPKALPEYYKEPLNAFQGPAIAIMGLASLFSRHPMTAAMNAGAELMKGYHEGDVERIENARQNYKEHVAQVVAQNKLEQEKYDAILNNAKFSQAEKLAKMHALAAAVGDEIQLQNIKAGNFNKFWELQDAKSKMTDKMLDAAVKVDQADSKAPLYSPQWFQWFSRQPKEVQDEYRKMLAERNRNQASMMIDQGIVNVAQKNYGLNESQLGFIPRTEQPKVKAAITSGENIEDIADYVQQHPGALGVIADAANNTKADAWSALLQRDEGNAIDNAITSVARRHSESDLSAARILSKKLTTQAFADAAAAGSRGATQYLDKIFRDSIYSLKTGPEGFIGTLKSRYEDADRLLQKYGTVEHNLGFDNNKGSHPFWDKLRQPEQSIPPGAIEMLRANPSPERKKMFEETFHLSAGKADEILKQPKTTTAPAAMPIEGNIPGGIRG